MSPARTHASTTVVQVGGCASARAAHGDFRHVSWRSWVGSWIMSGHAICSSDRLLLVVLHLEGRYSHIEVGQGFPPYLSPHRSFSATIAWEGQLGIRYPTQPFQGYLRIFLRFIFTFFPALRGDTGQCVCSMRASCTYLDCCIGGLRGRRCNSRWALTLWVKICSFGSTSLRVRVLNTQSPPS